MFFGCLSIELARKRSVFPKKFPLTLSLPRPGPDNGVVGSDTSPDLPPHRRQRTLADSSKKPMKRAFLGALGGALFGGVIAAAIPSVLFGAQFLYYWLFAEHNYPPLDQVLDSAPVLFIVAFSGIVGIIVGALAGVASRVPAAGISFLRCCIFIALAAAAARLLTMPRFYASNDYSYIASFVAFVIATGILILVGLNRGRSTQDNSPPATHTD